MNFEKIGKIIIGMIVLSFATLFAVAYFIMKDLPF